MKIAEDYYAEFVSVTYHKNYKDKELHGSIAILSSPCNRVCSDRKYMYVAQLFMTRFLGDQINLMFGELHHSNINDIEVLWDINNSLVKPAYPLIGVIINELNGKSEIYNLLDSPIDNNIFFSSLKECNDFDELRAMLKY